MNFQDLIENIRGASSWLLRVYSDREGEPMQELGFPPPGTKPSEYLREAGFAPGKYRLELARVDKGQGASGLARSIARVRNRGFPVSTVVELREDGSSATPEPDSTHKRVHGFGMLPKAGTKPRATMAAVARAAAIGEEDPDVERALLEARRKQAEAASLRAELDLERVRRELAAREPQGQTSEVLRLQMQLEIAKMRAELAPAAAPRERSETSMLQLVVPLLQTLLQSQIEGSARREQMYVELAQNGHEAPQGMDSLSTALPLLKHLLEFSRELNSSSGEKGPIGEIAELVREVLPAATTPAMLAPQQAMRPMRRKPPTTEDQMRWRVISFLLAIQREAEGQSDAGAAADRLEQDFLLCPREFRELVLAGNSLTTVLAGLTRFVPAQVLDRLNGSLAQDRRRWQWLEEFLRELQPPADDDQDDDDEQLDDEDDDDEDDEQLDDAGIEQTPEIDVPGPPQARPTAPEADRLAAAQAANAAVPELRLPPPNLFGGVNGPAAPRRKRAKSER